MAQKSVREKWNNAPRLQSAGIIFLVLLGGMAAMVYSQTAATISPGGVAIRPTVGTMTPVLPITSSAIIFCNFNNSTTCVKKGATLAPLSANYTIVPGGVSGSKAALIPEKGGVGIYSNTGMNLNKGTVEAWINPVAGGTRPQYLFSMQGEKSLSGDAYNDLVFGETGSTPTPNTSHIFLGASGGVEAQTGVIDFPSHVIRAISAGDIDGDHKMDLLTSNNEAGQIWIFDQIDWLPGTVLSAPGTQKRINVFKPQGNTLADLDNDGDLDLVVASYGGTPIQGFENDGSGNFTAMTFGLGGYVTNAEGIDVVDFDNDGVLDMVYGSFAVEPNTSLVFYGRILPNGKYTIGFAPPDRYAQLDAGVLGIAAGDLDQDGWNDVVQARVYGDLSLPSIGELVIRMNDGAGNFPNDAAHRKIISTSRPFTVAIRDVDNDGYLDIATSNYKPNSTTDNPTSTVFRGPEFTSTLTYDVMNAVSLTIGDMDGDGLNDIALHSSTGGNCPIYYLNLDGTPENVNDVACQPTWQNGGGPGSGIYAAIEGSTPYGRSTMRYNDMELYYNPLTAKVHFTVYDTDGKKHEVSAPYVANGTLQKVQAMWNGAQKRLKLIIGNPTQGVTQTYTATEAFTLGYGSPIYRIGTNGDNQYSLNGIMDEFRISTIEVN